METLQKLAAAQASIHNHFDQDRHLNRRNVFKPDRPIALAEWRETNRLIFATVGGVEDQLAFV